MKEELKQNQVSLKRSKATDNEEFLNYFRSKEAIKVLKGKKLYIKRDLLVCEENQTLFEDILKEHAKEETEINKWNEKIIKLWKKNPSSKTREIYVNKEVLEGIIEEENTHVESKLEEKDGVPKEFHHDKK